MLKTVGKHPTFPPLPVLVGLWAVVALFDVTKAVHIDDTAHLQIAEVIAAQPLKPMSGLVNWDRTAEPVHKLNQPHLLFYLVAGVMRLYPRHAELALHLVWILFSGAAIALFYALARRLTLPHPLLWTAVFCLGPAFLPAQNLMVDVPLTALWLAFFHALVRPGSERPDRRPLLAALVAGFACLVKYTSLVLLPVLAAVLIVRRRWRALVSLLVPIAFLAVWSVFNWFDYGGVHILERPVPVGTAAGILRRLGMLVGREILWLIALGAISPFSLALAPALVGARSSRWLLVIALGVGFATAAVGIAAIQPEPAVQSILRGVFLGNGVLVVGLAARSVRAGQARARASGRSFWFRDSREWLLAVWVLGAMGFIVAFSPFMAIRHVLLALPGILALLALGPEAANLGRARTLCALAGTALLGMGLGVSDWILADVYRSQPAEIARRYCHAGKRCVTYGHWGWQWYAGQAGFEVFDDERTHLGANDIVVIPELVGKQPVRPSDAARLAPLATVTAPTSPWAFLRTIATEKNTLMQDGRSGGYYYFWTSLPWTVTRRPLDRFRIYSVAETRPAPEGVP